jgi:predicted aldo/keto reductase-like oxidoreductase
MRNKEISRRQFIEGVASAGVVSVASSAPTLGEISQAATEVVYRTLGKTGLRIPVISFGVMNSDNPELLRSAIDMGVRHFDTAHRYLRGNSEKALGEVVEASGKRDQVILGTKMRFARDRDRLVFLTEGSARSPGATENNLVQQLDLSLERLRTDYVDILYLHSCYSPAMATFEPMMNALVKVKQAGKARFIGVTTHHDEPNVVRATADAGVYDVVLTSYNFMQDHKKEVKRAIEYASSKGVGVVAMKTQGGVRLNRGGNVQVNHRAALKWALSDPNVCTAIPGITAYDQLELDFSVMGDLELTAEEERELTIASLARGPLYCQSCRDCVPSCPERVEVPSLMRAFMYAEGYGNLVEAQSTVADLPAQRGLAVCGHCSSCTAACSRGIDIEHRVRALQGMELDRC